MNFELSQRFFFEAAHTLDRKIDTSASARIHGHTYYATVTIAGQPDPVTGMLVDLGLLRKEIEIVRESLDHHYLNELHALGPVTLENLCRYIYEQMKPRLGGITRVLVERPASGDACTLIAE
jgi:6-pyruvoyltetrahydropterin/6-carboxytetrahydropterin synthase